VGVVHSLGGHSVTLAAAPVIRGREASIGPWDRAGSVAKWR
jgi:hypothetical protein